MTFDITCSRFNVENWKKTTALSNCPFQAIVFAGQNESLICYFFSFRLKTNKGKNVNKNVLGLTFYHHVGENRKVKWNLVKNAAKSSLPNPGLLFTSKNAVDLLKLTIYEKQWKMNAWNFSKLTFLGKLVKLSRPMLITGCFAIPH